jgi:hypothetical protein
MKTQYKQLISVLSTGYILIILMLIFENFHYKNYVNETISTSNIKNQNTVVNNIKTIKNHSSMQETETKNIDEF